MESEGERFLAYYLMKNEEEIPNLEDHRSSAAAGETSDSVSYAWLLQARVFNSPREEYCVPVLPGLRDGEN